MRPTTNCMGIRMIARGLWNDTSSTRTAYPPSVGVATSLSEYPVRARIGLPPRTIGSNFQLRTERSMSAAIAGLRSGGWVRSRTLPSTSMTNVPPVVVANGSEAMAADKANSISTPVRHANHTTPHRRILASPRRAAVMPPADASYINPRTEVHMHGGGLELALVFLLAAVIAVPVFRR